MRFQDVLTFTWVLLCSCITVQGWDIQLTPRNAVYCTSQNLTMTCSINGTDLASDLVFTYNKQTVDADLVTIVNSTTAEYVISNKIPEKNFFKVGCCYKTCQSLSKGKVVWINVYETPAPVENFQCLMHQLYSGKVHCTWNNMLDYNKQWHKPDIYFLWRSSRTHNWTRVDGSKGFYDLNSSDVNLTTGEVGVNVSIPQCGTNVVTMPFYHAKIIQLPAVTGLKSEPLNTTGNTCVQLSWDNTIYDFFDKAFEINCTNKWGIPKVKQYILSNRSEVTVCDLIPATAYECNVKVKFMPRKGQWKDSIWSPNQSTSVTTNDDLPGSSPRVTNGSYMWMNSGCSTDNTKGSVSIYWQPIQEKKRNGLMTGTVLTYISNGSHTKHVNSTSDSTNLELDCRYKHSVKLQAANNKGISKIPANLTIDPPWKDIPELIVEVDNSVDKVKYFEWNYPLYKQAHSYTIFRAAKKGLTCDFETLGTVQWNNVPAIDNSTQTYTESVDGELPHCFGISVQTTAGTSGLKWTDCVYVRNRVPVPPTGVSLTPDDHSLFVRWDRLGCSTGQPYIQWYEVGYCIVTTNRQCKEGTLRIISRSRNESSALVYHLNNDSEYRVNVRAVTRFNEKGNWSTAAYGKPVHYGLSIGQIAGIVIGIVFCLALAPAIYIICRKFNRRKRELQKIETPYVRPDPELGGQMSNADNNNGLSTSPTNISKATSNMRSSKDDGSKLVNGGFVKDETNEGDEPKHQSKEGHDMALDGYMLVTQLSTVYNRQRTTIAVPGHQTGLQNGGYVDQIDLGPSITTATDVHGVKNEEDTSNDSKEITDDQMDYIAIHMKSDASITTPLENDIPDKPTDIGTQGHENTEKAPDDSSTVDEHKDGKLSLNITLLHQDITGKNTLDHSSDLVSTDFTSSPKLSNVEQDHQVTKLNTEQKTENNFISDLDKAEVNSCYISETEEIGHIHVTDVVHDQVTDLSITDSTENQVNRNSDTTDINSSNLIDRTDYIQATFIPPHHPVKEQDKQPEPGMYLRSEHSGTKPETESVKNTDTDTSFTTADSVTSFNPATEDAFNRTITVDRETDNKISFLLNPAGMNFVQQLNGLLTSSSVVVGENGSSDSLKYSPYVDTSFLLQPTGVQ